MLSLGQIWSHNLEFSKQTAIWHRDICGYSFDVYFFTMLAIQVFGEIWSRNLPKIVSKDCYACCMPNFQFCKLIRISFLKLRYSNNKHRDAVYVLLIDRVTSVKELFSNEFSEDYRALISVTINLHLYLRYHYSTDALHTFCQYQSTTWFLQKWNVTSTKY